MDPVPTPAIGGELPSNAAFKVDSSAWAFDPGREGDATQVRTLSCVIWSCNEASRLTQLLPQMSDLLTACGHPWEIVVIDAHSTDGTADLLRRWGAIPAVRSVTLQDPSGASALSAGLAAARGDAVIFLDANLQHKLALIPQMISHWEGGAEVVYALRQGLPERSELNWIGPSVFDGLVDSPKPLDWLEDCAELTLLNRRVINYLSK